MTFNLLQNHHQTLEDHEIQKTLELSVHDQKTLEDIMKPTSDSRTKIITMNAVHLRRCMAFFPPDVPDTSLVIVSVSDRRQIVQHSDEFRRTHKQRFRTAC
ncbi:hypothetical protein CDAR_509051 [Caerostris darwini]|uniref:Uncharacterized protein n=1 Tax=Caerostris darwini TaxID=1538125 RepID=A0AAV4N1T4_9ARAC|nr:hypothetical protein CDAR_509051 [Caerostris darwini]